MKITFRLFQTLSLLTALMMVTGCVNHTQTASNRYYNPKPYHPEEYAAKLPQSIDTGGVKTVLVDPNVHAWGAYDADGQLVRAGIATSGGTSCPPDSAHEGSCRTDAGVFRIYAMQGEECASKRYPRPNGGGLMPYCMYFNKGEALHGSPDNIVIDDNISHGCVRMRIPDAEWMQKSFASIGTKVIVMPYN